MAPSRLRAPPDTCWARSLANEGNEHLHSKSFLRSGLGFQLYKVEFENDQVRVLRIHYGPHKCRTRIPVSVIVLCTSPLLHPPQNIT